MTRSRAWHPTPLRLVNLGHFLDHYFLLIFPTAVLAIHREWDMSYGEALALGTPAFFAFAAGTPVAGWLGDRIGGERMMAAFFAGLGITACLTAFAAGPLTLMAGLTGIGLFASIYHPVGIALLVRLSADAPGRALGVNGVYGNLGVAAAAGLTGLVTATLGWRAAFLIPGVTSLLLALMFRTNARPAAQAAGVTAAPIALSRSDQMQVLAVIGITALAGGVAFNGITIALPKLIAERLPGGDGLATVGAYAAIVFAVAAFAQIPSGRLLDRIGARPMLAGLSFVQIVLMIAVAVLPGAAGAVATLPLTVAVFAAIPITSWLVGHFVAPAWRSRAYSMQFLLSLGVSAAVVPLVAILHQRTGGSAALFGVLAATMAVVFAAAWLLPGTGRRISATVTSMPAE